MATVAREPSWGTRFVAVLAAAALAATMLGPSATGIPEAGSTVRMRVTGSDPWEPLWQRTLGQEIVAVATDPAGAAYVTGAVNSQDGYWKTMVVAKYARNGDQLWKRVWRPHTERYPYSAGSDVAVSPDGDTVYVGGAEFNDSTETARARLWAYSADGHIMWTRVGWPGWSVEIGAVAADDIGAVVGGTTRGECGPHDGLLAAYDPEGTQVWTDPFEAPGYEGTSDSVEGVAISPQGKVYAVGSIDTTVVGCDEALHGIWSDEDIVIMELSTDGAVGWTQVLADPDVKDRESALDVEVSGDQVVVAGRIDANRHGIGRAWLASFSATGDVSWLKIWGPAHRVSSSAVGVSSSAWGPLYVTGFMRRTIFLMSLSLSGSPLTVRRLEGARASGVATGPDHTLYVTAGRNLWRMPAG